jgi:putative hydrolase of the HAD superfamily
MKTIAFDLGKVLFDFDYDLAFRKMKKYLNATGEEILKELLYNNFAADFEKGLVSDYDFYLKFKNKFAPQLNFDKFIELWCAIFYPKHEVIGLLERLSCIYPVYLISNINEAHFRNLKHKYPQVFSLFNGLLLSFEIKAMKPEIKIYEELKKISHCDYQDIVYIDDRQDLISVARELGINCIEFSDLAHLCESLRSCEVMIPTIKEKNRLIQLKEEILKYNRPLILAIGNNLRGDDAVAPILVEEIKGKTSFLTFNAGANPENYLNKIAGFNADLIIFTDAAKLPEKNSFGCFPVSQLSSISLQFTHDSALKLIIEYLKNIKSFDILILAINALDYSLGNNLSSEARKAKDILKNFFLKHFSLKHS